MSAAEPLNDEPKALNDEVSEAQNPEENGFFNGLFR
jgi:hypothetical protein